MSWVRICTQRLAGMCFVGLNVGTGTQITGHIKPVGIGDMHRFIGVVSFSAEKGCWPILACIGDTYHLLVMCVESGIGLRSAIIS